MIYIIYGPTGSGKTDLAVEQILKNRKEKHIDGEIISADSRQIYIGMNIGTNKDKDKYIDNNINYHLIDILTPDKKFSVWDWNQLVKEKIKEITSKESDVYIVGGTGLYIDSLLYPRKYSLVSKIIINDNNLNENSLEEIKDLFMKEFPNNYEDLNESEKLNKRRLINNLIKLKGSLLPGNNVSVNNYFFKKDNYILITPVFSREVLYEKINNRVDKMFEEGFVKEVENLINKGYGETEAMNGIGYREISDYLKNNKSITEKNVKETKDKIKKSHRNYAKRQMTWFKKYSIE